MIEELEQKQRTIQRKFGLAWLILTAIIASALLYYQFQQLQIAKQQHLQTNAQQIAFRFDDLMQNFLQAAFNIPFIQDTKKPASCHSLLSDMHKIIFNHPAISGLFISEQDKILCKTTLNEFLISSTNQKTAALYGPFPLSDQSGSFFVFQQRVGTYNLGVIILSQTLLDYLQRENHLFKAITLYDTSTNKTMLSFGNIDLPTQDIRVPLQNVENIDLLFTAIHDHLSLNDYLQELLTIALVCFCSFLFYYYFRQFLSHRYSLNYALSNALQKEHFYPVYQAVWNASENRYDGAEVLIRWQTDVDTIISPDYFIEEAEKTTLIIPITLKLIEKSFQQCKRLLKKYPDFTLAFNLCPLHFCGDEFFTKLHILCDQYNVMPSQIILELTERNLFTQHNETVVPMMQALRDKGFSIAVDDFGTGHASINYLRLFPFNYLKIDKLFINSIGTGAITETLNQAIIDLANTLQLEIIAEGVETKEQYHYLRQKGVVMLQGWYFCKIINDKQLLKLVTDTEINYE